MSKKYDSELMAIGLILAILAIYCLGYAVGSESRYKGYPCPRCDTMVYPADYEEIIEIRPIQANKEVHICTSK